MLCTSDTRERMLQIIKAYNTKLTNGCKDGLSCEVLEQLETTPPRQVAISLARDAFKSPRKYYFVAADKVPTHCLHIDLLPLSESNTVLFGEPGSTNYSILFEKVISCEDGLVWLFISGTSVEELSSVPPIGLLKRLITNIVGRDSDVGAVLGKALQKFKVPEGHLLIFGEIPLKWTVLAARMCVILYLMIPIFGNNVWPGVADLLLILQRNHVEIFREVKMLMQTVPADEFCAMVSSLQDALSIAVSEGSSQRACHVAAQTLQNFFDINFYHSKGIIQFDKFYSPIIEDFSEEDARKSFIAMRKGEFSFCQYLCLVDTGFKYNILQMEAQLEHSGAVFEAMTTPEFSRPITDFFLVLKVRRSALLQTTLLELQRHISKVRKPLRVIFTGEEGIDEGGIRKEFFQLVGKELLSIDFGMFTETPAHDLWVVPDIKNDYNAREFWLIGMVIGLAVYNNVILDLSFPTATFKKLLDIDVTFEDLIDLDPDLANGLQQLMDFDEERSGATVEDTFARTFVYEHDIFGVTKEIELCPGGSQKPLTAANIQEYVDLLIQYILVNSVKDNFAQFKRGFTDVCNRDIVMRMRPEELELLICGNPLLDFNDLEESTSYDGYEEDDEVIRMFWDVLHSFSDLDKRKFLKFCTGSDRIPVRGLSDLKFVIGKNGDDESMLPTAHTCFNHLLLPQYKSEAILKEKLLSAIQNCEGFGLR